MSEENDIKTLRQTLGLSQKELGKKLGVRRDTISLWERGITSPTKRHAGNLDAIFADCPPPSENDTTPCRKKRYYNAEEEATKKLAENIKAISRTFTEGQCYTISETPSSANANTIQQSILQYERKEGIHHVFREIRGKWIVTYTDAQLIGKIIRQVEIHGNGSP